MINAYRETKAGGIQNIRWLKSKYKEELQHQKLKDFVQRKAKRDEILCTELLAKKNRIK